MSIRSTLNALVARHRVLSAAAGGVMEVWNRLLLLNPRMTPVPFGFSLAGNVAYTLAREPEIAVAAELMRASDVVIDVGANAGLYGCVGRKLGKTALFVEPDRLNLRILRHNLAVNGWTDSEVWPVACGDHDGAGPLFGSGGTASLHQEFALRFPGRKQTVPIRTLDGLIDGRFAGRQLFIKIDVEGHEYQVLSGAAGLLRRVPKPFWFVESFFGGIGGRNEWLRPLFQRFWDAGYAGFDAQDAARRPVSPADLDAWIAGGRNNYDAGNWIFLPAERR